MKVIVAISMVMMIVMHDDDGDDDDDDDCDIHLLLMLMYVMFFLTGPVCYGGSNLKHYFGYDDALGRSVGHHHHLLMHANHRHR